MGVVFSEQSKEERSVFEIPPMNNHYEVPEDIINYCQFLQANSQDITDIIISYNTYSEEAIEKLTDCIQECPNITNVNFSHIFDHSNDFDSLKILDILGKTLLGLRELRNLDLSHNNLSSQALDTLGFLLENTESLKNLNLNKNPIGDEGASKLADSLKASRDLKLHVLKLNGCNIGENGAISLGEVFEDMRSFREIDLSWNNIRKKGTVAICRNLVNSEKLQVFKIAGNYLNDPLASLALSKAIRGFKYLSILSCGDACIGNYGIKKLLSSLDGSEYLLRIELEYNEVDQNDIGDDILKLLHTKKNLEVRIKQVINISGFDLSPEMIDRIKIASSKYDKFVEVILVDAHESSYEDLPILDENESIIAGFLYEDLN